MNKISKRTYKILKVPFYDKYAVNFGKNFEKAYYMAIRYTIKDE